MVPVEFWSAPKTTSPTRTLETSLTSAVPSRDAGWVLTIETKELYTCYTVNYPLLVLLSIFHYNFLQHGNKMWNFSWSLLFSNSGYHLSSDFVIQPYHFLFYSFFGSCVWSSSFFSACTFIWLFSFPNLFHPAEWPGWPGARHDFCLLSNSQDQVHVLLPGPNWAGRHLQGYAGNRWGNGEERLRLDAYPLLYVTNSLVNFRVRQTV